MEISGLQEGTVSSQSLETLKPNDNNISLITLFSISNPVIFLTNSGLKFIFLFTNFLLSITDISSAVPPHSSIIKLVAYSKPSRT